MEQIGESVKSFIEKAESAAFLNTSASDQQQNQINETLKEIAANQSKPENNAIENAKKNIDEKAVENDTVENKKEVTELNVQSEQKNIEIEAGEKGRPEAEDNGITIEIANKLNEVNEDLLEHKDSIDALLEEIKLNNDLSAEEKEERKAMRDERKAMIEEKRKMMAEKANKSSSMFGMLNDSFVNASTSIKNVGKSLVLGNSGQKTKSVFKKEQSKDLTPKKVNTLKIIDQKQTIEKPESKLELKPEVKPEVHKVSIIKQEIKPEPKPESKPEIKQDVKSEPKSEIKPEIPKVSIIKPEPNPEIKPEVPKVSIIKQEIKAEPKQLQKSEIKPEVHKVSIIKSEPKPEVKPEVKPTQKSEIKPEVKPISKSEIKPEVPKVSIIKQKAKPETKSESKEKQLKEPKETKVKVSVSKKGSISKKEKTKASPLEVQKVQKTVSKKDSLTPLREAGKNSESFLMGQDRKKIGSLNKGENKGALNELLKISTLLAGFLTFYKKSAKDAEARELYKLRFGSEKTSGDGSVLAKLSSFFKSSKTKKSGSKEKESRPLGKWEFILSLLGPLIPMLGIFGKNLGAMALKGLGGLGKLIGKGLMWPFKALGSLVGKITGTIGKVIGKIGNVIGKISGKLIGAFKNVFGKVFGKASQFIGKIFGKLGNLFNPSKLFGKFGSALKNLAGKAGQAASKIGKAAKGLAKGAGKAAKGVIKNAGKLIKGTEKGIKGAGKFIGKVGKGLAKPFSKVLSKGGGKVATKVAAKGLAKFGLKAGLRAGAGALKAIPGLGAIATVGMAAFDAYSGWKNAASITGKKEKDLTWKDRTAAAGASVLSGLTFGLVSSKTMYKGINAVGSFAKKAFKYSPVGLAATGMKKAWNWLTKPSKKVDPKTGKVVQGKTGFRKILDARNAGLKAVGNIGKKLFKYTPMGMAISAIKSGTVKSGLKKVGNLGKSSLKATAKIGKKLFSYTPLGMYLAARKSKISKAVGPIKKLKQDKKQIPGKITGKLKSEMKESLKATSKKPLINASAKAANKIKNAEKEKNKTMTEKQEKEKLKLNKADKQFELMPQLIKTGIASYFDKHKLRIDMKTGDVEVLPLGVPDMASKV